DSAFVISGVDGAVGGYVVDRPMRMRDALEPLLLALGADTAEQDGRIAVLGRTETTAALRAAQLAQPEQGASVRAARVLEAPPDSVRVRFIDEAADYQTGSVVLRSDVAGGGGLDADLPAVCSAGVAMAMAHRILAQSCAP